MNSTEPPPSYPSFEKQKVSWWKKLGGGSLTISLIVHGIILIIGIFLVIQVIPSAKEPPVDFLPKGGGGGAPSATNAQKVRVNMPQSNASRIAAKGATSAFSLPEPDPSSDMTSLSSLDAGAMSGGMGGKGTGGGKGDGQGLGVGDGMGIGVGGSGNGASPFGMTDPNKNALVGTFYDLKQDKHGKPTELSIPTRFAEIIPTTRQVIADFVKRGWNDRIFNQYYQAPQKLYQTRITMPSMPADTAPKAFGCENVPGSRWVVIYRGSVRPPKSGKYRFVGAGDDVLAIRFNGKNVFDFGYESVTANVGFIANRARITNSGDKEWSKLRRDLTMPDPLTVTPYAIPGILTRDLGGLATGLEFEANANTDYPIEILISEVPGGFFAAYLLIEEIGAPYPKTPEGFPILPIFRTGGELPPTQGLPPFNPVSPVWTVKQGIAGISDI